MKRTKKQLHQKLLRAHKKNYPLMFSAQGGVCAICGRPPATRRLHIDHNHSTMKVRGLLCFKCNTTLRRFVTVKWLEDALNYLRKYE